jgi:hypothetical protein
MNMMYRWRLIQSYAAFIFIFSRFTGCRYCATFRPSAYRREFEDDNAVGVWTEMLEQAV